MSAHWQQPIPRGKISSKSKTNGMIFIGFLGGQYAEIWYRTSNTKRWSWERTRNEFEQVKTISHLRLRKYYENVKLKTLFMYM